MESMRLLKRSLRTAGLVLGIAGLALVSGEGAIAGLQQTRLVSRNADGSFLVVCTNGDTETATRQEILSDDICEGSAGSERADRPDSEQPNAENELQFDQLTCAGDESLDRYYITRVDDDTQLGTALPLQTCRSLVANATDEHVCSGNTLFDRFYITRIEDGTRVSDVMPVETCREQIQEI
ncbi:MAG: hypothetical protein AAFQ95_02460 [Cyanobacteria bacterium J06621_3]